MFSKISATIFLFFISTAISFSSEPQFGNPVVGQSPQAVEDNFIEEPDGYEISTWVQDLEIPWSLVFLSKDRALLTERPGRVRLIENGTLRKKPYKTIEKAEHIGEGGLMGIEKHPDYPRQNYIYLMYTYRNGDSLYNRLDRYRDTKETLKFDRAIVRDIPAGRVHNGGRIAFGPDEMLYVCTGDTGQAKLAQDKDSLAGKILRYTPEGKIPSDNPFENSPVYSLGHRNPQGLAWHEESGALFSSEHGPSGEFGLYGRDIINLIRKGKNYGWPLVLGEAGIDPYIDPLIMWEKATPPSGMSFFKGKLYLATLRSKSLVRINFRHENGSYEPESIDRLFARGHFRGNYGRLRDAVKGPDGSLYVLTSNRDGRGNPAENDDRILKITPK